MFSSTHTLDFWGRNAFEELKLEVLTGAKKFLCVLFEHNEIEIIQSKSAGSVINPHEMLLPILEELIYRLVYVENQKVQSYKQSKRKVLNSPTTLIRVCSSSLLDLSMSVFLVVLLSPMNTRLSLFLLSEMKMYLSVIRRALTSFFILPFELKFTIEYRWKVRGVSDHFITVGYCRSRSLLFCFGGF